MAKKEDKFRSVFCDLCDSDANVFFECLDCEEILCEHCKIGHERSRATKTHTIRNVRDSKMVAKSCKKAICENHSDKEVSLYCHTCNDLVCTDCVVGPHRKHDFIKLTEAKRIKQHDLSTMLNDVKTNVIPMLRSKVGRIEQNRLKITERSRETVRNVNKQRTLLVNMIDNIFKEIEEENKSLEENNTEHLKEIENEFKRMISVFCELDSKYSESVVEIISTEKMLKENLKKVKHTKEPEIHQPRYIASDINKPELKEICGFLETGLEQDSDFESFSEIQNLQVKVRLKSSFEYKSDFINTICPVEKNKAWIHCSKAKKDDLVTINGEVKKSTKLGFLAIDFGKTKDGNFLASSFFGKCIKVISQDGNILRQVSDTSPLHPKGICETRRGDILVSLVDDDDYEWNCFTRRCVMKLNSSGEVLQILEYQDGKKLFTKPFKVSENIDKSICVVDLKSENAGCLCIFDQSMKLALRYNGQSSPFYPQAVVCDSRGRILLSDYYNKIHLLSKEGRFLQFLVTQNEDLERPFCLALDRDEKYLWVGTRGKTVRVYDYSS